VLDMRAYAGILLTIGLLLLTMTAVAAADPLKITQVSTSNQYPVANGVDQAIITISVQNSSTLAYLSGANVTFTVDNTMGSMSPKYAITDASGRASSTFTAMTKSGIAHINVSAQYDVFANALPTNVDQKVDHDIPLKYTPIYNQEGVVGSVVPFTAYYTDYWGNPIDNIIKPGNHSVKLEVYGPAPDDDGFVESGFSHLIIRDLDSTGNLSVNIRLTSKPGFNNIHVYPFGGLSTKWEWIESVTKGIPYSISAEYFPPGSPPSQIINNDLNIKYSLLDKFGNPAGAQQINVTSDGLGAARLFTTSSDGFAYVPFSQPIAGDYVVSASTVSNNTLNISGTVHFYNANASVFTVTANPQMMPSLDANPSITSNITVTVMDSMGNPVKNETVTFSAPHSIQIGTANATGNPSILNTNGVTDVNGIATAIFVPGSFANITQPGYIPSATGTCLVTATWNGISKDVTVTWKNYPYLSAVVALSKPVVFVNDTFDVSIKLNGDGWALVGKPIDVALATDRSGSMAGQKITDAINADKLFINDLKAQDQVGLVSFGGTTATTDLGLSYNKAPALTKVGTYVQGGNTPMRDALYRSANMIKNNARANSVRAIVLLTDGEWNTAGDPLGVITSPNAILWEGDGVGTGSVINYIKNNNMKLYIIGLGVTPTYQTELQNYVNAVGGGKYYNAPNSSQLDGIYTQIAGELRTEAGVDTTATMDMTTLTVNNASISGLDVLDYVNDTVPLQGHGSTWIHQFNQTFPNIKNYIIDQYPEWRATRQLNFNDIGTIHINETWETSFRFMMLRTGNIALFNGTSCIKFNDTQGTGVNTLCLPNTTVIGQPNWTGHYPSMTIVLENLNSTATGEIVDTLPMSWDTIYTGNATVTEDLYYKIGTGPWTPFDQKTGIGKGLTTSSDQLSVASLPPGAYLIKVKASAPDAPSTELTMSKTINIGGMGKYYIKLE
jgi:hypothetical protein